MSPLPLYATPGKAETALFLVEHRMGLPVQLVLLPNLRLSGLLCLLPPDLLRVFVTLLTFQEGNGEIRASVSQIAQTLQLHHDQAEALLQALATYTFDGAAILFPSGESIYSLSKRVGVPVEAPQLVATSEKPYRPVPRAEVVERSRRRYATPRAEAEAAVIDQLGIVPAEPIPEGRAGDAYHALLSVGVPEPQVRQILKEAPIEEIEAQLAWLPERGARNPGRFILAAVRGSYAPPPSHEVESDVGKGDE